MRLKSLIEKREYILQMFCKIQLVINMMKGQGERNREQIVKQQIEIFEIEEDITTEEKNEFINIYKRLDEHDCGELLEYLVQTKGPYEMDKEDIKYSIESKVYHQDMESNHNFDVIFYPKNSRINRRTGRVIINDEVEFHECKNNVLNWLPANKERLQETRNFRKVANKLEFCKKVKSIHKNGTIYIPTLAYNVQGKQACLDEWGYDFIQILNVNDLIKAFFSS